MNRRGPAAPPGAVAPVGLALGLTSAALAFGLAFNGPPSARAADAVADVSGARPTSKALLIAPAKQRFAPEGVTEAPDFQKHVLPVLSRLGCNGRACHGSFQGRGGFRLSLFGYDFKADHEALLAKDKGRVDVETPEASKILQKPTLAIPHKGGKRMDEGSWAYRMLARWVEAGAKGVDRASSFDRLEVTPAEVVFDREGTNVPLKVVARWEDGTSEDVTCLCRFRTNDESVAEVSEDGVVTSRGKGDTHVVAFYDNGVAVAQVIRPVSDKVGPKYPDVPTPTKVDALVVEKLRKLGVVPSAVCTDAEFLRRVRVDLTGTLPTPPEVAEFLADPSPDKRVAKVDALLNTPEYAGWWATKVCDLTGANPRQFPGLTMNAEIVRNWYAWVAARVARNEPYDKIVAGIVLATSRLPGQSFDDYAKQETTYYRADAPGDFTERPTMPYFWARRRNFNTPDEKALGFSYTFLGVRLECAQCHKHPFDQWTQDDFKKFTAFFAPVGYGYLPDGRKRSVEMRKELGLDDKTGGNLQRELGKLAREGKVIPWQEVFINAGRPAVAPKNAKAKGRPGTIAVGPKLLGGGEVDLASYKDPRQPLMDWMRSEDNPYFAKALVNRVWANYFGRGIVHPTDDMNRANPPSNPALLDHLTRGFIAQGFDLKWLHREVLASQAYQRSWRPNETNRLDERNFSKAAVRRLPAEVLIDAVAQVTGASADLAKVGTTAGLEERAIGPKGGGRRGQADYASRVFGRNPRETTCDCAASTEPNLLQSIYLQNDGELLGMIERKGGWLDERTGASARSTRNDRKTEEGLAARFEKRVGDLEAELETARKGDQEKLAEDLELQLSKRRDDLTLHRKRLAALPKVEPPKPFEADAVIDEAFLRALGRRPSAAEADGSRAYFADARDDPKGLRDLLWALLNTKEFVTNH